MIGEYSFKSPYHKNKRLPFFVIRINSDTVFCETVEYKGHHKKHISGNWSLNHIKAMVNSGFLRKEKG